MRSRSDESIGATAANDVSRCGALAGLVQLRVIADALGQDPALTVDIRTDEVRVCTATSNTVLQLVLLDGAVTRTEAAFPAIEVSVWPEPALDWVDSPRRRATSLNRQVGLGAVQTLLDGEGGAPLLQAVFELEDGLGWESDSAALLRLFADTGGDWMLHRTGRPVFERHTLGLAGWHRSLARLPTHGFGRWTLLKRLPGHVIVGLVDHDLADEAAVHIELNRPHPRLGSGLRYTLYLARHHANRARHAMWCEWLNQRETHLAIGTSHIGAWHIAADGRLAYTAFIPSLIGDPLPNLPMDLLCGSVARACAAIEALGGRLPL